MRLFRNNLFFGLISLVAFLVISCSNNRGGKEVLTARNYMLFHGSKGLVCWKIGAEKKENNSVESYAEICFPITEKKIKRISIGFAPDTNAAKTNSETFVNGIQRGDRFISTLAKKGYEARNIYTGEIVETKTDLENKYPQLKTEKIDSVTIYRSSQNFLKVKSKNASTFFFDLDQQIFYTQQFSERVDSIIVNEKCNLYFAKGTEDGVERNILFKDSSSIRSSWSRGKIFSFRQNCIVIFPGEVLLFSENWKLNPNLSKYLESTLKENELEKLSVFFNAGKLVIAYNGLKKFIYVNDVSDGTESIVEDPEKLFGDSARPKLE
jgi:hypothetical protein